LNPKELHEESASCDLQSASLYARLALQLDPSSLPARRLLALTFLHGAQPFPFGPSSIHSSPLSLNFNTTTPTSSASISGAHAAIEVLKDGTEEVFLDVGCARIFAKACSILGKTQEGKDAMAWTIKQANRSRSEPSSNEEEDDVTHATPPPLDANKIEQAFIQTELASLAAKGNRYDEAKAGFIKARNVDSWSWTAWVGLCDVGSDDNGSAIFPVETHRPSFFYPLQLENRLLSQGFDKEVVKKTMKELKERGEEYYLANEAIKEEGGTNQPMQRTGSAGTVTTLKRPVENTIIASTTSTSAPPFARPGTKPQVGATAIAGTKRVRTTTAGSSQGGSTAAKEGGGNTGKSNVGTVATDIQANKRPAVSGIKSRGAPQQTAISNARTNGTLSAVRTNEQQWSTSSASGSTRGAGEKVIMKPRRSARVNVDVIDEPAAQPVINSQRSVAGRPPSSAVAGQAKRMVARPAGAASEMEAARKAAPSRTAGGDASTSKNLLNVMQTSAFEAARQAAVWTTVDKEVKEILQTLGKAYCAVKNFQSKSALILLRSKRDLSNAEKAELRREFGRDVSLDGFTGLEDCHRNSVDVQCLMARAYHDLSRYHLAESHFLHARRLSPTLDTHMDIFSLTLFHLQREVQLSKLARELSLLDANSCISHIAKGNTFALQREHSLALQSFQRACLAAPNCAYAFTLAGYEAFELGFKDKSVKYFRQSVNIEKRHWNAFAGLGQLYFESERLSSAAYYYGRAISIHKSNPVLWDVYGGVLSAQGKLKEAESAFERAIELDPSLAMSHIKLAEVYLLQGETEPQMKQKAHNHLLEAVKYAPEEAHVHLMLAHTYMEKGSGSFARIDQGGKGRAVTGGIKQILLPSELQQLSATGIAGPSTTARAIGNSKIPNKYQAEIARHLCAAIDLDPRYVRYVKAMGEGAKAALRGIVSRFLMDGNAGGDGSTLLMDSSAMTEGQTLDSMVDLDGDQVLEDQGAMTEELQSVEDSSEVEDEREEEEEEDDEVEQEDEEAGMMDDSQSVEEMMEASLEDQVDVENDFELRSSTLHPPSREESDVSMSF